MSFVAAEGAYTSYSVYDTFDDASMTQGLSTYALVNCLETKAILVRAYATDAIKVYDIASKTVGAETAISSYAYVVDEILGALLNHTFLNTYFAVFEAVTDNLLIYKNGVLIQTITAATLGIDLSYNYGLSFSPRGKYIFIAGKIVATGVNGWIVLVGA